MFRENLRDVANLSLQGVVIGGGGTSEVDPRHVVVPQQGRVALFQGATLLHVCEQGEPPGQKVAAQRHVLLTVSLNLRVGPFQFDVGVRKAASARMICSAPYP